MLCLDMHVLRAPALLLLLLTSLQVGARAPVNTQYQWRDTSCVQMECRLIYELTTSYPDMKLEGKIDSFDIKLRPVVLGPKMGIVNIKAVSSHVFDGPFSFFPLQRHAITVIVTRNETVRQVFVHLPLTLSYTITTYGAVQTLEGIRTPQEIGVHASEDLELPVYLPRINDSSQSLSLQRLWSSRLLPVIIDTGSRTWQPYQIGVIEPVLDAATNQTFTSIRLSLNETTVREAAAIDFHNQQPLLMWCTDQCRDDPVIESDCAWFSFNWHELGDLLFSQPAVLIDYNRSIGIHGQKVEDRLDADTFILWDPHELYQPIVRPAGSPPVLEFAFCYRQLVDHLCPVPGVAAFLRTAIGLPPKCRLYPRLHFTWNVWVQPLGGLPPSTLPVAVQLQFDLESATLVRSAILQRQYVLLWMIYIAAALWLLVIVGCSSFIRRTRRQKLAEKQKREQIHQLAVNRSDGATILQPQSTNNSNSIRSRSRNALRVSRSVDAQVDQPGSSDDIVRAALRAQK